jgi:hypothetical protein
MNKRIAVSSFLVFVTVFITDALIHGKLLMGEYAATAHLWRTDAEMQQYFPWMTLSQFLSAVMFVIIFSKNCQNKGLTEGLRYGALMGLFMGAHTLSQFAYMPISGFLITAWIGSAFGLSLLCGAVTAAVFKKIK